jgi:hypothetical protein
MKEEKIIIIFFHKYFKRLERLSLEGEKGRKKTHREEHIKITIWSVKTRIL